MSTWSLRLVAVVIATALTAAACGGGDSSSTSGARARTPSIKVGLLLDDLHERWQRDRDMISEVVTDMKGELLVAAAEGDPARQLEQAEQMLDQGVQALIVVASDTSKAAPIVERAREKKVPVISYDRLIENADVDLFIGFDIDKIGRMQAQYLAVRAPKGNYLLIGGAPTDGNAKILRRGQLEVLQPLVKSGAIRIVGDGWATGWKASEAAKLTEQALDKTRNNLTAIVASNDVTAGGAIEVLEKRGLAGKVLVSGQDAELDAARRIVAGTQTMTVYKSLRTLTRLAARSAMLMARGEAVDTSSVTNNGFKDVPTMLFDPIAVDRDNLDGIVIADGFLKRDDVYGPAGTR